MRCESIAVSSWMVLAFVGNVSIGAMSIQSIGTRKSADVGIVVDKAPLKNQGWTHSSKYNLKRQTFIRTITTYLVGSAVMDFRVRVMTLGSKLEEILSFDESTKPNDMPRTFRDRLLKLGHQRIDRSGSLSATANEIRNSLRTSRGNRPEAMKLIIWIASYDRIRDSNTKGATADLYSWTSEIAAVFTVSRDSSIDDDVGVWTSSIYGPHPFGITATLNTSKHREDKIIEIIYYWNSRCNSTVNVGECYFDEHSNCRANRIYEPQHQSAYAMYCMSGSVPIDCPQGMQKCNELCDKEKQVAPCIAPCGGVGIRRHPAEASPLFKHCPWTPIACTGPPCTKPPSKMAPWMIALIVLTIIVFLGAFSIFAIILYFKHDKKAAGLKSSHKSATTTVLVEPVTSIRPPSKRSRSPRTEKSTWTRRPRLPTTSVSRSRDVRRH